MRKRHLASGILAFALCGAFACACTACHNRKDEAAASATPAQEMRQTVSAPLNTGKTLVAYFSVPETDGVDASSGASRVVAGERTMGNTEYVARLISEATGGELFEIKTVRTYPGSHQALIDAAKEEADAKARPQLATHIENLDEYGTVFIGFPNWWYDMPMPIYSFLDEYDFSGKTIVPFCTHGGSRFSQAVGTIRQMERDATVLDGYAVARDRVPESKESLLKWLEKTGLTKQQTD